MVYVLFKKDVHTSDCIALNSKKINDLERIWKEVKMA
jgi:hypothetical protein